VRCSFSGRRRRLALSKCVKVTRWGRTWGGSLISQLVLLLTFKRSSYQLNSADHNAASRAYRVNMVNQHPSSVKRSAISGQMSHSHDRLCGPCQAMFMTDGMDAVDIDEIGDYVHYSDGSAFIAAARSNRCYICT
jgi:hypothetical protein